MKSGLSRRTFLERVAAASTAALLPAPAGALAHDTDKKTPKAADTVDVANRNLTSAAVAR